jgi:phosphoribosylformimino-5-aminoimidazole carboxamide ribonucleotide (ProFAR) isomerase
VIPVINLESFQNVALDTSSGVVQVGGGVRLGNLADGIYQQGKRALSHGTCMFGPQLSKAHQTNTFQALVLASVDTPLTVDMARLREAGVSLWTRSPPLTLFS